MSNDTRTVTGVAELCALPPVDKWQILEALSAAAEEFDLNHRTLSVLRALITFLPAREIQPELNSTIVFPSNRTLSERLHGMPESTLRRHLSRLVDLGVITRHDSANRKRFARRGTEIAYGFDLSPLAVHAEHITRTAQAAEKRAQTCRLLRDEIACLRRDLIELGYSPDADILCLCKRMLRRKLAQHQLTELRNDLANHLATTRKSDPQTSEVSSKNSQNERHKQTESNSTFDSEETAMRNETGPITSNTGGDALQQSSSEVRITLTEVLAQCNEFTSYFPTTPRSWSELQQYVHRLLPMIGIESPVYWQAERAMGSDAAATTVLCILERLPSIRNPGGYLRQLCKRAELGLFSLSPMLAALRIKPSQAVGLSADNV